MPVPAGQSVSQRTPRQWQTLAGHLLAHGATREDAAATLHARGCPPAMATEAISRACHDLEATQSTLVVIGALLATAGLFLLGLIILLAQAPPLLLRGAAASLLLLGAGLLLLMIGFSRKMPLP